MSSAISLSTRTVKIYSSAYDGQARAEIDEHVGNIANPHGVTAAQVGLGAANDTSDADKPVSTAQAAALALKAPLASPALSGVPTAPTAPPGTVSGQLATTQFVQAALNALDAADTSDDLIAAHLADTDNPHAVNASDVGLGNVDNTSDADKPVSDATQIALNLKAPLSLSDDVAAAADAAADAQAAADAAQADATQAAADAATAQAAADAAQAAADAAQAAADAALDEAAAVDSLVAGVPSRPGDAVGLYGETKTGEPEAVSPIDPAWVVVSAYGSVVRVTAATAADPQTVAPVAAYPVEPGRIYEVRWRVQRIVNPADPLNDSVTCGLQWLTSTKAANGSTVVDNIALTVANGVQQRIARIGSVPATAAPANTIYFRPYVDCFGDAHTSDVITIDVQDVTAALAPQQVPFEVLSPASGALVTLDDLNPIYINNGAVLAALTVRLPPATAGSPAATGNPLEIGFAHPITSLIIQDAAGVAVAGTPVNAYGPGSAHEYRYIDSIGWVHWK